MSIVEFPGILYTFSISLCRFFEHTQAKFYPIRGEFPESKNSWERNLYLRREKMEERKEHREIFLKKLIEGLNKENVEYSFLKKEPEEKPVAESTGISVITKL